MEIPVKANPTWAQRAWMLYFLLSIAFIGFIGAYCIAVPMYLLGFVIPLFRKMAAFFVQKAIYFLMAVQPWLRSTIRIDLPPEPYKNGLLLISNHRSHLDVFIFLSRVKGVRFLGNRSLFYNPFIGPMLWIMGNIPASKNLASFWKAMELTKARLKQGEIVCIFPELTRCEPGFNGVQDFTSAPFMVASQVGATILPICIEGTDHVWPKGQLALNSQAEVCFTSLNPITDTSNQTAMSLKDQTYQQISTHFSRKLNP